MYAADAAARQKWIESNEETNRRVDTSTKAFAEQYQTALDEVSDASDKAAEAAKGLAEEMPNALEEIGNAAKEFDEKNGQYLDNIASYINNIATAIEKLKAEMGGIDKSVMTTLLAGGASYGQSGQFDNDHRGTVGTGYASGGYTGA